MMEVRRVALITLAALGALAALGVVAAGLAGTHAQGTRGLFWDVGMVVPFIAISGYTFLRHPGHPTAERMLVIASLFALQSAFEPPDPASDGPVPSDVVTMGGRQLWIAYTGFQLTQLGIAVTGAWLFGLYPDGRVETARQRRVLLSLWIFFAAPVLLLIGHPTLVPPSRLSEAAPENPFFVPALGVFGTVGEPLLRVGFSLIILPGIVFLMSRYRRADDETRASIKWLLLPLIAFASALVITFGLGAVSRDRVGVARTLDFVWVPLIPAVALAASLGLSRRRPAMVDVVLRRSLVYALIWLLIASSYIGVAATLGVAASERFPVVVAILLTIGVTIAFQPVRRGLEALADRWVFGRRMSRHEALSRLGRVLEEAFDLDEVLPQLARTVREGLGLAWVRVQLTGEGGTRAPAAVSGNTERGRAVLSMPVEMAGERLGELVCGPKLRGAMGEDDRAALDDLARQAALAVRNVGLAAELADRVEELRRRGRELEESRLRLIQAEERERRRIERDLHDGIQQDLVALIGEVGRARARFGPTNSEATSLLGGLQEELARVLHELRELAHGIHPQILMDRGLLEAVETRARMCPLRVAVRAPAALRDARFPPEIEAAAYFTVCEGLANILKHAHACSAEVRLDRQDGSLLLIDVVDDGVGPATAEHGRAGHGLRNLSERLAAFGGCLCLTRGSPRGARLHAELPITAGGRARG